MTQYLYSNSNARISTVSQYCVCSVLCRTVIYDFNSVAEANFEYRLKLVCSLLCPSSFHCITHMQTSHSPAMRQEIKLFLNLKKNKKHFCFLTFVIWPVHLMSSAAPLYLSYHKPDERILNQVPSNFKPCNNHYYKLLGNIYFLLKTRTHPNCFTHREKRPTSKNHSGNWIRNSKGFFRQTLSRLYYNPQHDTK